MKPFPSKAAMRRAFRKGHGVYDDGQSSWSVNCQIARANGRLPLTQAAPVVRRLATQYSARITLKQAREALLKTHDGEWHHTSKYGNRTDYYDPSAALAALDFRPQLRGAVHTAGNPSTPVPPLWAHCPEEFKEGINV
jgi:hypothetical protein